MSTSIPAVLTEPRVRQALSGDEGKPIGRTTLWRLIKTDPEFPAPFKIGNCLRWYEEEIAEYLRTRPRRQYTMEAN